ncbi:hypothetical protein GQ457_18G004760 [Hibiscus cannabinus]
MNLRRDKDGWMVIKVDLIKAFDCLRWDFIDSTLVDAGFHTALITLIMHCVTSSKMQRHGFLEGSWDWTMLQSLIVPHSIDAILNIVPPNPFPMATSTTGVALFELGWGYPPSFEYGICRRSSSGPYGQLHLGIPSEAWSHDCPSSLTMGSPRGLKLLSPPSPDSPLPLVRSIVELFDKAWFVDFSLVPREANVVVDHMAKIASQQDYPSTVFDAPPESLVRILHRDIYGSPFSQLTH